MKYLSILTVLFLSAILIGTSCKKPATGHLPSVPRKIQFLLYTNKDFSDNNNTIRFRISIQNSANQSLLDSPLAVMKIKDIPDLAHKIVIEKTVSENETSLLKVGFLYSIDNVGNSWFFDSCKTGETFKTVNYNFQ